MKILKDDEESIIFRESLEDDNGNDNNFLILLATIATVIGIGYILWEDHFKWNQSILSVFLLGVFVIIIVIVSKRANKNIDKLRFVEVELDKKNNFLLLNQSNYGKKETFKIALNALEEIKYYTSELFYPDETDVEPALFKLNFRDTSWWLGKCWMFFYYKSGEFIPVSSSLLTYTDVYKNVALEIGKVTNIPVSALERSFLEKMQ